MTLKKTFGGKSVSKKTRAAAMGGAAQRVNRAGKMVDAAGNLIAKKPPKKKKKR